MSFYGGPPHGHPGPPPPPGTNIAFVPAPVMMPIYPPQQPPPIPSTNPTFVNNYYYPQAPPQPEPVQVVEDPIEWVSATRSTARNFNHRAFKAGNEGWDGSPLCVIRAHHNGELVPGKLAIKHEAAYIPYGGKEVPVHNFELLLAKTGSVRWLPGRNGQVPDRAIPAGNSHTGEPLYIGRVLHKRSLTPGKLYLNDKKSDCENLTGCGNLMSCCLFKRSQIISNVIQAKLTTKQTRLRRTQIHPSHQSCYISFGGVEIAFKVYDVLCRA